jgi:ATP-dependent DNA ligase
MLIPYPMPLSQQATPFDHPDWIFEIKHDGFRALSFNMAIAASSLERSTSYPALRILATHSSKK